MSRDENVLGFKAFQTKAVVDLSCKMQDGGGRFCGAMVKKVASFSPFSKAVMQLNLAARWLFVAHCAFDP